ncbi:MAG: hypothetical protein WCT04_09645 [Planctomycetota bacterium]
MIELIIGGALLLATLTLFWPWIVNYFTEHLIPWIKEKLGNDLGCVVEDLLVWADKGIASVRNTVRQLVRAFSEGVLGIKTEYEKTSSETATSKTTTYLRKEDGKAVRQVVTEEIDYDELPPAIREEMLQQHKKSAVLDVKEALLKKIEERAAEEGMELGLSA